MAISIGVNAWVWTSPFTTDPEGLALMDKAKQMGFDSFEFGLEDPSHVDAAKLRQKMQQTGLRVVVCGYVVRGPLGGLGVRVQSAARPGSARAPSTAPIAIIGRRAAPVICILLVSLARAGSGDRLSLPDLGRRCEQTGTPV